jgi:hypothetical protein
LKCQDALHSKNPRGKPAEGVCGVFQEKCSPSK